MDTLVPIFLVVFGAIGGALAIFGTTQNELETHNPLKRINRRGWFAIVCIGASLVLGVMEKVQAERDSKAALSRERKLSSEVAQSKTLILQFYLDFETQMDLTKIQMEKLVAENQNIGVLITEISRSNAKSEFGLDSKLSITYDNYSTFDQMTREKNLIDLTNWYENLPPKYLPQPSFDTIIFNPSLNPAYTNYLELNAKPESEGIMLDGPAMLLEFNKNREALRSKYKFDN